jgi:hypothetical protein
VSGEKGDPRLARLHTLVGRAVERCGERAGDLRVAHDTLLELARHLEPPPDPATGHPPAGAVVRARVEARLDELTTQCQTGAVATWLRPKVEYVATVLRRLGDGLFHCYDVPGLPRTDNAMEQFYRRVKTEQRRITGRKRADAFVVRVGGFAVYATAASTVPEAALLQQLATVPADAWQQERITLRTTQARQATMRRFRLHRDAYLAALERRWTSLALPP